MSARRGPLTVTRFFVRGAPPKDLRKRYLQAIRARAFEALKPEGEPTEATGWCVMDRPLDLEFDAGNVYDDHFLLLGFRIDRFRIPASMVRTLLADEEQRFLSGSGKNRLSRNERLELKDKIVLRLRKKLPPSTRCLDMVWDLDAGLVLFFSHSRRTLADFTALFEKTFGLELDEDSPYLAAQRAGLSNRLARAIEKLEPMSFSDARKALGSSTKAKAAETGAQNGEEAREQGAVDSEQGEFSDPMSERIETTRFLGPEFLLWIWLRGEFTTSGVELGDGESFHVWLERQLVFESPFDRNERVTIRGVAPADGNEAREALGAQKFPVRARIMLQGTERDFALGLDAPRFAISSATLPSVLKNEPSEAFLERMALAEQLFSALDQLYATFLHDRLADTWTTVWQPAILAWIETKTVPAQLLQGLKPKTKSRAKATPAERV